MVVLGVVCEEKGMGAWPPGERGQAGLGRVISPLLAALPASIKV